MEKLTLYVELGQVSLYTLYLESYGMLVTNKGLASFGKICLEIENISIKKIFNAGLSIGPYLSTFIKN